MTEIVFIGIDMDQAEIIRSLDACLLTESEMQSDWSTFPDPLPIWEEELEVEAI